MFDLPLSARKKGTPYYIVWQCAFNPKKFLKLITKEELLKFDIKKFLEEFEESLPTPARAEKELTSRFSLYLTGNLLLGVTRVFAYRGSHILENAERIVERINQPWDTLSPAEESSLSPVRQQQRPMSPMDVDFDYMEEPRPEYPDNDVAGGRPVEDFHDEEEPRLGQQPQDEQPAAAGAAEDQPADEDDQEDAGAAGPQPKRRTRKRRAAYTDDEDDDFGQKRKPRRKPTRKGAVANVARHEDITMREDVIDSLERDLIVNDLEPLDENALGDIYEQPIHLNDDTVLVVTNGENQVQEQQPADTAPIEHDFDYQEMDVQGPGQDTDVREQGKIQDALLQSQAAANVALQSVAGQESIQPEQQQPEEARFDHDFDYQDMEVREYNQDTLLQYPAASALFKSPVVQERLQSVSPARIIAINMIRTPEPSAPPSSRSATPIQAAYNFEGSRSVTPVRQQHDVDHDFDYFERPADETAADDDTTAKQPRQKRPRRNAREPVITFDNDQIANRDQQYLQKDLRNAKYGKFRTRLDNYRIVYKNFLGPDVTVEVNDDLRDFLDERIGRLNVERARRRATRDAESVGNRPSSRMTQLGSRPGTPVDGLVATPKALEEEQQQMGDPFANDFDNDFRPMTPPPADEHAIQMEQDNKEAPTRYPPFARARTPIQQFQEIEYVDPVPLPDHMAHLLSPPRPLPVDLFNTSSKTPFKELSCKFDHDDLYWLILHRCVKQNKVVFTFKEFADGWPRPYIAKQFHNFLLLTQLRKILARNVDGVFHSFIIVPNDDFKMNIAKMMARVPATISV